jgi:prepilin-type processing-associated H-X9-DG protein
MNYSFATDNNPGAPPYEYWIKMSKLKNTKILAADGYRRIATNLMGDYGVYRRHNKGANYLFPDWHVEWSNAYHKELWGDPAGHWYVPRTSANSAAILADHPPTR